MSDPKAGLRSTEDPRMPELSGEIERVTAAVGDKAVAERELADEIQSRR